MANLEIRSVSKAFKTGKVLDRISLSADKGEIVAIVRPVGIGQDRASAAASPASSNRTRVVFCSAVATSPTQAPETRGVGMAFQNFALFPHMSAFDNIASALTAHEGSARRHHARRSRRSPRF